MPSLRSISRRAAAGAAIACAVGVGTWVLRHGDVALVAGSTACAGVLDALAAWLGRLAAEAPLGRWLLHVNETLRAGAIGGLAILLRLWTGSWWVAAAVALAVGLTPAAGVGASPFDPAVLLVVVATLYAVIRQVLPAQEALARPASRHWRAVAFAGLLAMALIAPRSSLLMAAIGLGLAMTPNRGSRALHGSRGVVASGVIAIGGLLVPFVVPALPPPAAAAGHACGLLPADFSGWTAGLSAITASLGPYAAGLAALGLFVVLRRRELWRGQDGGRMPIGLLLLALVLFPSMNPEPAGTLLGRFGAPLAGYGLLIAAGLAEIAGVSRRRMGGRLAGALLLSLLPALSLLRLGAASSSDGMTWHVDRLSSNDVRHMLSVLPDNSVLVEEGAAFDALVRGLGGFWQRSGKGLRMAAPEVDSLSRLVTDPAVGVYALPAAQRQLQWLGFKLADAGLLGVTGVATVGPGGQCAAITRRWTPAPSVASSGATVLSVVTLEVGEPHGLVAYVALDGERHPAVVEELASGRIGFQEDIYSRGNASDQVLLSELMYADEVPPALGDRLGPVVARLEIWRDKGLPAVLPVELGGVPSAVLARSLGAGSIHRICPAFPYKSEPVEMQR